MSTKKQGHERIRLYEPDRYEYQDPMLARSLVQEGVLCRLGCLINFTQLPLSPEIMNNYPDIYRRIKSETSPRGSTTTFRSDTQGDRLSFVKVTLTDADKNDDQATDVGAEQEVTGYYGFDDNLSKMSDFLNEVSEKYSESDTRLQHKEQYNIKTPRPGMVTGTLTIAKQEIARRKASQTQALKEAVLATLKELLGLPYDHLTIEESPVHADLWQAILSRNEARGPEAFDRPYCQRAFFAILKHTDKQQRADSEMMASVIDEVFEKLPLMVLNALQ